MAQSLGDKLDSGQPFPDLTFNLVSGETRRISEVAAGQWSVVLLYRGHW
jgi:peroxiredoxin